MLPERTGLGYFIKTKMYGMGVHLLIIKEQRYDRSSIMQIFFQP